MPCPGHEGVPPPNLDAQMVAERSGGSYSHPNSVPVVNDLKIPSPCHGLGSDDNGPTSVVDKGLNHLDSPMNPTAATIEPLNCEHRVSGSPSGAVLVSVTPGLPAIQTPIPTGQESHASLVHSSVETGIQLRSLVGSGNFEGHLDMDLKPPSSALESLDESVGLAGSLLASDNALTTLGSGENSVDPIPSAKLVNNLDGLSLWMDIHCCCWVLGVASAAFNWLQVWIGSGSPYPWISP
ncbi:hypothetical protein Nepgr_020379 [Nepenthes gracilis]|uniref:Uncharacterized protein n=1 Tax=Nepenthes gracilis TaxID=150966 RepID=A0AAD3XV66_NEPGR|nr:hypothetical protein Nepgr_020379 [Nepenthes gracilis]